MATIQDHSNFKVVVKPEYSNWWSFYFEFFFKDKPVFNPEILRGEGIKADEWESSPLLPVFEKAMESKTDGETFSWSAWEDEVEIEIKAVMKNPPKSIAVLKRLYEGGVSPKDLKTEVRDGVFDFTVFVAEQSFGNGEMNYGFQNAGVKLYVDRPELKKFYEDLKAEMAVTSKKREKILQNRKARKLQKSKTRNSE